MDNICIVSSFKIAEEANDGHYISSSKSINPEITVYIYKTKKEKCLRCWQHKDEVKTNEGLCNRCSAIIKDKF